MAPTTYQPSFHYAPEHLPAGVRALHDRVQTLSRAEIAALALAWHAAWSCTHHERATYTRPEDKLRDDLFAVALAAARGLAVNTGGNALHEAVLRRCHTLGFMGSAEHRELNDARRAHHSARGGSHPGDPADFTAARCVGTTARALVVRDLAPSALFDRAVSAWRTALGELPH